MDAAPTDGHERIHTLPQPVIEEDGIGFSTISLTMPRSNLKTIAAGQGGTQHFLKNTIDLSSLALESSADEQIFGMFSTLIASVLTESGFSTLPCIQALAAIAEKVSFAIMRSA